LLAQLVDGSLEGPLLVGQRERHVFHAALSGGAQRPLN
jgi:hypothetical protein